MSDGYRAARRELSRSAARAASGSRGQHSEEATPGGLADLIGGAFSMSPDDREQTIPLYGEELHVAKATVITDRLRVTTSTDERAVVVEESIERGHLRVERVAIERAVDEPPEPRQDGDTLIVSVVEERLVVEKRLYVVEELRITRSTVTERVSIPEIVRTMRATVERTDPETTGRETDG